MKKLVLFLASVFVTSALTANASMLLPAALGTSSSFTDVTDYTSYYDSIEWMQNNDIVSGYADGSFGADQCVNRAEFLKMMYKVQDITISTEVSENPFKDVPKTSWYAPYVKESKARGAINGYPDGTFRANQFSALMSL